MPTLGLFKRADPAPDPAPGVPQDLALAIAHATVTPRGEPDPVDGTQRLLIQSGALGAFHWEGPAHAAERIARIWPDITPRAAERAARLLADVVAMRLRAEFRGQGRRRSWVRDW
jgi:hypothetical protein